MLAELSFDDFKDHRGGTFVVEGTGGRVEATLVAARLSPYASPGLLRRHPFAILFTAPAASDLGPQVYNIRHPEKGLMEGVFINPVVPAAADIAQAKDIRFYEAVFN
ncbi:MULTISPECIES: DUF6916 family protein [Inquilinus]|uniref:DUF6916 domain-containing protein n=1 Tax=Inquilinus ginsengisoli TaxID=363840 RepID=A0ABU1JXQ3_9PROT|nr:hypothetical protein [Inquilinus ginsengisoli]MDR6293402.1 hypothetical protein [Inquilinus ginsengisoli]